jgi:IclR family acetate operon transcriptional repressor
MIKDNSAQTVQASETTFKIVETLKQEGTANISELARILDMSKSTVHSHLATLEEHEYVTKNDEGQYRLGLSFFDLGEHARSEIQLYKAAVPVIDDLATETGEKAQVMVEEHGIGYYVYRSQGENAIMTRIGRRADLHCTSAGKVMLAFMPREKVERIIEEYGLSDETDQTLTDPNELFDTLDIIREEGVAYNDEERLRGLRAVGAPILDDDGNLLGSVSVSGPTTRIDGDRFRKEIPDLVQRSANVINIRLQYV